MVTVSVLGSVDLVTDERSAADHLADSENTISLDSVDADTLPVALGKELSPVSLIGGFGPDLTVCREDCVERGRWGETFSNVDLLGDVGGDGKVVLNRFGVACEVAARRKINGDVRKQEQD